MKYVEGDLFDNIPEDKKVVIAHVCNDQGKWGSGFVIPLGNKFPLARESYFAWAAGNPTDEEKVRYATSDPCPDFGLGEVQFVQVAPNIIVANMVAQTLNVPRPLYYNALAACMDDVVDGLWLDWGTEYEFLCPMFGAARAGGDWEFVTCLIGDCWERSGLDVTICYLPQFLPAGWVASNGTLVKPVVVRGNDEEPCYEFGGVKVPWIAPDTPEPKKEIVTEDEKAGNYPGGDFDGPIHGRPNRGMLD